MMLAVIIIIIVIVIVIMVTGKREKVAVKCKVVERQVSKQRRAFWYRRRQFMEQTQWNGTSLPPLYRFHEQLLFVRQHICSLRRPMSGAGGHKS